MNTHWDFVWTGGLFEKLPTLREKEIMKFVLCEERVMQGGSLSNVGLEAKIIPKNPTPSWGRDNCEDIYDGHFEIFQNLQESDTLRLPLKISNGQHMTSRSSIAPSRPVMTDYFDHARIQLYRSMTRFPTFRLSGTRSRKFFLAYSILWIADGGFREVTTRFYCWLSLIPPTWLCRYSKLTKGVSYQRIWVTNWYWISNGWQDEHA